MDAVVESGFHDGGVYEDCSSLRCCCSFEIWSEESPVVCTELNAVGGGSVRVGVRGDEGAQIDYLGVCGKGVLLE